jgi:photosystem I subunit 3
LESCSRIYSTRVWFYITGWIGWVGRKYIRAVSTTKIPAESEIIINVPLALKIMTTGYIWQYHGRINKW